jgi:gliding motility-associated-like protein
MVRISRIAIFYSLFCWHLAASAQVQNLVPNPGFETYAQCPYESEQLHFAVPWKNATQDPSNFYHACSSNPVSGVPSGGGVTSSYKWPRNGEGHVIIRNFSNAYRNAIDPSTGNGIAEYIITPLLKPLEQGQAYYLEFFVSPNVWINRPNYGYTDAIGLSLTDTSIYREIFRSDPLPLSPAIENRGVLITDTAGWTRISGCYTAKGGERYATIGNFRSLAETMLVFEGAPSFRYVQYSYIDDVFIGEFNPLPDTLLLCEGEELRLNAAFLDAQYRWSTGQADSAITVQAPGVYVVEAVMEKCVLRDTVVVISERDAAALAADTTVCMGERLTLKAPLPGTYQWSNGAQSSGITVFHPGQYALTVANECGVFHYETLVETKDCACRVYVPTAFSPNGDGINDRLEIFPYCDWPFQIHAFKIFDRWGGQVYSYQGGDMPGWDGLYKGMPAPSGPYVWLLQYSTERNGVARTFVERGEVNLMR